ncbi:uncharacterized protein LOC144873858 [Branchiostoma floridae x Branchiostoma japonicum]
MLYDNGFEQLVNQPTRECNTLDLFLTNCPDLIPRVEIIPGLSDHNIPYCEINTSFRGKCQTQRQIPLYARADWDSLRAAAEDLSTELQVKKSSHSTDELWSTFKDKLLAAIKKFIPHKTARPQNNLPWITPNIRRLINKRDRKYRRMKKTGSAKLREEYKSLRRTIQRQIRRSYWSYLNSIFTEDSNTCQVNNKRSRKPFKRSYVLHGHTLETVSTVKYLGTTMSENATWDTHINTMVTKANKTLGFLRRNLKISSVSIKEKAYKAFVRPVLEYASSVWDPHTKKNTDKIEAVQRRAARFVLNRFHNTSSVSSMLSTLGWQSLKQRRKTARLGTLFKIHHGIVQCPVISSKLVPPPTRQRRKHNCQFKQITTRTLCRDGSFLPRTIKDWNSLPAVTVEAATVDTFVSRASAS